MGIEGQLSWYFVVNTDGSIQMLSTARHWQAGADEEAVKVVK